MWAAKGTPFYAFVPDRLSDARFYLGIFGHIADFAPDGNHPVKLGPARLILLAGAGLAFGIPAGVGIYAFFYARGLSYLSDDPKACINCHVMNEQYRSWSRSSHHAVATCNQCHVPQGFLAKYMTKAEHGYRHSVAFTSMKFDDPIRMKPSSRAIVEHNCKSCHKPLVESKGSHLLRKNESCIRCHSASGHPG